MNGRPARAPGRMGLGLILGNLLFLVAGGNGFHLARRLVLGQIKFFLNFTLAPGQFLKALLALELRADFFAKLFDALVGIGDVQLQSFRAFLKSLNRRLQRADGAERRVRDPRAVTVASANDHFRGVVETRTQEQIKTGEPADFNVVAKPRLQFFRPAHDQFARNAPVVGFLTVEFNAEFVARRLLPDTQILPQIGEACGKDFRTGIEIDPLTARIAKVLYPDADIRAQAFEQTKLADGFYDLAVSNVPFGDYTVHDPRWNSYKFSIHDYFFAAALEKVRPGGLMMFITSRGTMDKLDSTLRELLSTRTELLGAIRLPNDAFKKNAGTEVTTDIVMLRKLRPGETPAGPAWKETAKVSSNARKASPSDAQPLVAPSSHTEACCSCRLPFFPPCPAAIRASTGFTQCIQLLLSAYIV